MDLERKFEREHKAMCGEKVRYATREEAEQATYLARMQTRDRFDAYECPWCHNWHIGHRREPGERRR